MRILLAAPHRYPAYDSEGSGLHPKAYPSGSGYHLHDLLAKGLAEEGHEVCYYTAKGAALPPPPGVRLVSELNGSVDAFDICHAPIGPAGFAESVERFAEARGKPCLLTCHMLAQGATAQANWVFVSRTLAADHGCSRVVLNGIDPGDFRFSAVKGDYFLFLCAMHRAAEKGLAFVLALAQRRGARLIAAGTGLNYETVEQVAAQCAAAGAAYVGDVRGCRKAELIAGARALLFASRLNEGCPLVALEAMVSGTPVVANRKLGPVEILTPEVGILCDGNDEWERALDRVGDISPARCREIAIEKYHYRRMVRDYLREYQVEVARA